MSQTSGCRIIEWPPCRTAFDLTGRKIVLITAQEPICIQSLLRIFTALKGKDETRNVNKQLLLLFFLRGASFDKYTGAASAS